MPPKQRRGTIQSKGHVPGLALRGSASRAGHLHRPGAAIVALFLDILHRLALSQRPEPVGDDVRLMDKQVAATAVGRDEAKALSGVEPSAR